MDNSTAKNGSSHRLEFLNDAGYHNLSKITDTLQGSIWRASHDDSNVVIKATSKYLHENAMAVRKGTTYHNIDENIVLESSVLKYLTNGQNTPKSMTKYCHFLESDSDYFLVQEDGGQSLFTFITRAHQLISRGNIRITDWHKTVKTIFKQMVECIEYIHSKRICHFDISLENFLINDVPIQCVIADDGTHHIEFVTESIQIKLCDFGLATSLKANDDLSNRFVGKTPYKSPENVLNEEPFNAMSNDIWGIGICLFMMLIGSGPWECAKQDDPLFKFIMNGYLPQILSSWKKDEYVNPELIDLFRLFFQFEEKRIGIDQIKKHPWMV